MKILMKAQSEKKILETSDEFSFRKSDMLSFCEILNCMMWLIDYAIAMHGGDYIYMNTLDYRTFIALCVCHNNDLKSLSDVRFNILIWIRHDDDDIYRIQL